MHSLPLTAQDASSRSDPPVESVCKPLPDGLSRLDELPALAANPRRLLARIQARSYAGMLHVIERFADGAAPTGGTAGAIALPAYDWLRRLELAAAAGTPNGYRFVVPLDFMAQAAHASPAWARHALALAFALQAQAHYRASIEPDDALCGCWRALFLENWRRVAPRAVQEEHAWTREDLMLEAAARSAAVEQLLALVAALDAAVQSQAAADAACFLASARRRGAPARAVRALLLRAYRWQYVGIGIEEARFVARLQALLDAGQLRRLRHALAPLLAAVR